MNEHMMNRPLGIYGDAAMTKAFGVSPAKMQAIMAAQRETLANWKTSPPRPKAATNTSGSIDPEVSGNARAEVLGRWLGTKYSHDPRALATALEVPIVMESAEQLHKRAGRWVSGLFDHESRTAYVSATSAANHHGGIRGVIAHECAHALNIGLDDDRDADLFADAFLAAAGAPGR